MPNNFPERRRHPRLKEKLPLTLKDTNFDLSVETTNISCLGAYCRVNKYIKPLTKLKIDLILPYETMRGMGKNLVKCAGVVVRTEKTQSNNYDIAIYFNEITDADMQKISSYVNKRLNLKKDAMAEEVL